MPVKAALIASCLLKTWLKCIHRTAPEKDGPWSIFDASDSSHILLIEGNSVKKHLSLESGIHKVQRIPPTESKGRRHTSTIAVALVPYVTEREVKIPKNEFEINVSIGSGPGGQHRNKTESAVKVTHKPTKITAYSCADRSQHKNKEYAMNVVLSRIQEKMGGQQASLINDKRKQDIGNKGRGGRVRVYDFLRGFINDERIKGNFPIKKVMKGELDLIYKKSK